MRHHGSHHPIVKYPDPRTAALVLSLLALCPYLGLGAQAPQPSPRFGPHVVHHRADTERSGTFHFPAIRQAPVVKWRTQLGTTLFLGTPLIAEEALYTGGSDGSLYALDRETGRVLWSGGGFQAIENATVIAGDVIIGGGMDRTVRALERHTGALVWSFNASAPVFTPPLVVGDQIYVATYDQLHALDLNSGQERWAADVGNIPAPVGAPAFESGTVFVSAGNVLFALDSATGKERWRVESRMQFWSLAIGHHLAYVGNSDGYFYAYDQKTGQEQWRFQSAWGAGEIWSAPAIAGTTVYVGSRDGSVYAIDTRSGRQIWAFKTAGDAVGDPVLSNGMLYVSDSNHALPFGVRRLHALDASTGAEVWKFEDRSTLLTTPALGRNAIYLTITGQVIALQ